MYQLHAIPALKDNYIWLLVNRFKQTIIIDPGEFTPVIDYVTKKHLEPIAILLTHHHVDHTGGVLQLKHQYPTLDVYGPNEIDLPINHLNNHTSITIADFNFTVIQTPGHTLGHVSYYCEPYLFCGDTLFSGGCGRIFEGTYQQMFDSLAKLAQLPDDTLVCAAHEYTKSNLAFSHNLMPKNKEIADYLQLIKSKTMTLPSTLAVEKRINLFLQANQQALLAQFHCHNALELFTFFRIQKDNYQV